MLTKNKTTAIALAMLTAVAITGASRAAFADAITCAPNQVEWPQTLMIQCAPVNYVGYLSAPSGCEGNNQSIDTLKSWQSLAQAALLSGKNLTIYYNVCGGQNNVTDVVLIK
jgi:hypothetical protein